MGKKVLPITRTLMEALFKRKLEDAITINVPEDLRIEGGNYDVWTDCMQLIVSSEQFPEVKEGQMLDVFNPSMTDHTIKEVDGELYDLVQFWSPRNRKFPKLPVDFDTPKNSFGQPLKEKSTGPTGGYLFVGEACKFGEELLKAAEEEAKRRALEASPAFRLPKTLFGYPVIVLDSLASEVEEDAEDLASAKEFTCARCQLTTRDQSDQWVLAGLRVCEPCFAEASTKGQG